MRAEEREEDRLGRRMEQALSYASRAAGAGVCIYDLKDMIMSGPKDSLQHEFMGHYCGFCQLIRSSPKGREACIHSDVGNAVALGEMYRKPFFHTCHVGITELVVPVLCQDRMIAVVFLGQCRLKGETKTEAILQNAAKFSRDHDQLALLLDELPLIDRPRLLAAGMLLDVALRELIQTGGERLLEMELAADSGNHVGEAVRFIEAHYLEGITAGDVVNALHLHPSYLARLFRASTGRSLTEYIQWTRVQKAKFLLAKTALPISSIALNVGYMNQNYFTRQFSRVEGCTPGEYRKHPSGSGARLL